MSDLEGVTLELTNKSGEPMDTAFPQDDQFREEKVTKVAGGAITCADGWSIFLGDDPAVEPKVGQVVRFYGAGIGAPVRGLFLDGQKVFYRTAEEDEEHHLLGLYGADAREWLSRWDAGRSIWSIEMGGLGPGYEQSIQITAVEIVRHLLATAPDMGPWSDSETFRAAADAIRDVVCKTPVVNCLGLTGAQWGAALNLAIRVYRDGPRACLTHPAVEDRKIQVCRDFPGTKAA